MSVRTHDDVFHALDELCYAQYQHEVKKMKHVYLRNSLQSAMDDLLRVRKQLVARYEIMVRTNHPDKNDRDTLIDVNCKMINVCISDGAKMIDYPLFTNRSQVPK